MQTLPFDIFINILKFSDYKTCKNLLIVHHNYYTDNKYYIKKIVLLKAKLTDYDLVNLINNHTSEELQFILNYIKINNKIILDYFTKILKYKIIYKSINTRNINGKIILKTVKQKQRNPSLILDFIKIHLLLNKIKIDPLQECVYTNIICNIIENTICYKEKKDVLQLINIIYKKQNNLEYIIIIKKCIIAQSEFYIELFYNYLINSGRSKRFIISKDLITFVIKYQNYNLFNKIVDLFLGDFINLQGYLNAIIEGYIVRGCRKISLYYVKLLAPGILTNASQNYIYNFNNLRHPN